MFLIDFGGNSSKFRLVSRLKFPYWFSFFRINLKLLYFLQNIIFYKVIILNYNAAIKKDVLQKEKHRFFEKKHNLRTVLFSNLK